jgi:excisionase family DNA binding protein
LIYTVDEVSDLLSIPRPTLYRYLREYSIPHVRRSGKISIPEESFDWIREARELHKEGLGTETVRIRLREGNDLGAEELAERLDQLSEGLESLQDLKIMDGASSSQETLQTILERQDLLISAVSDLTERVANLLETEGSPQKAASNGLEEGARREKTFLDQPERLPELTDNVERETNRYTYATTVAVDNPPTRVVSDAFATRVAASSSATMMVEDDSTERMFSGPAESLTVTRRREKFGVLARRRRRGILALLLALLAGTVLAWGLLAASTGEEIKEPSSDEQRAEEDFQSVPAATETSPTVKAPYLVNMTLTQAEEKLAEAGLELGNLNEKPTYERPAGEVIEQDPQVGAEVEQGAAVNIVVSGGPSTYPPEVQADGAVVGGGADQFPGGEHQYPSRIAQNPDGGIQPAPSTAAPVQAAQAG